MRSFVIPARRNAPLLNWTKCIFDLLFKKLDYVAVLEQIFKGKYSANYAVCTSSGRKAMQFLIKSYGFPSGSEIIFPAMTFYILPGLINKMGFKSIFVNCNDDYQLDLVELKKKITKKTRAIVATHYFGRGCAIDEIVEIAKANNIIVIEDCAHVPGVLYKNKLLGTWGHSAFFSFQNRKVINGLTGGILLTNDKKTYEYAKSAMQKEKASARAVVSRILMNMVFSFFTNKYIYKWASLLLNFKLFKLKFGVVYQKKHHDRVEQRVGFSNFQARIVIEQLQSLNLLNQRRRHLAERYYTCLGAGKNDDMQKGIDNNYYAFLYRNSDPDKIKKYLWSKGIDIYIKEEVVVNCGSYYDPQGDYTKTQNILNELIELPMYCQLSIKDQDYIIKKLKEVS